MSWKVIERAGAVASLLGLMVVLLPASNCAPWPPVAAFQPSLGVYWALRPALPSDIQVAGQTVTNLMPIATATQTNAVVK